MQFIVDANVLLASFLKDAKTRELLLDARLTLFAPEHLITETTRHLEKSAALRKKIRISTQELKELFEFLTQRIETLPAKVYQPFLSEAMSLAPHREDAPYLAVALALRIPLWSNDKGLKNQTKVDVYSTSEVLAGLS